MSDTTELIEFALEHPNISSLCLAYDCWKEGKYTEPKTQTALEEILESGLESSEPDIAKMAAQVKLSRRLNNLYDINNNVAIDCSYITYVEYQLFIDDYTEISRHDTYHQVLAQVSHDLSDTTRLSLFTGFRFGRSSLSSVSFDDTIYGASVNVSLPLF